VSSSSQKWKVLIVTSRIAHTSNYAIIFSIKTFLALLFQSIIQFVIGKGALALPIQQMFVFFAVFCFLVCVVATASTFVEFVYRRNQNNVEHNNSQEFNLQTTEVTSSPN